MSREWLSCSLAEIGRLLRQGLDPVELLQAVLAETATRDPQLNCYLTLCDEDALQQAEQARDEIRAGGIRGPLHGVPLALKDLFCTRGIRTTAGSRILEHWVPEEDATVVRRLREAGAVFVGKTGMNEFAYGPTGENEHYGPVRNPHLPERLSGGSSSGSGAAVAAGMVFGALGSDTGGSIRIPAALCGIVGLKPTYGRVSRHGVLPLSWSLDHVGPLTRTVEDAALILEAIAGFDPMDKTSAERSLPLWREEIARELHGLRVALPQGHQWTLLDPGVRRAAEAGVAMLRDAGAVIEEIPCDCMELAAEVQSTLIRAEASAYHAEWLATRSREYGQRCRVRLVEGLVLDAVDYVNAQRARRFVQRWFHQALERFQLLVCPTVPTVAPRIGEAHLTVDGQRSSTGSWMVHNTFIHNVTGLPSISVPCGHAQGLPVGLQMTAAPWQEALLFRAGAALERRQPPPKPLFTPGS